MSTKAKIAAQRKVQYAIRTGRLERPTRCEACGQQASVHGHHADYSRPLDVRWLCPPCHAKAHYVEADWLVEACKLRDEGLSYAKIGKQVGRSGTAVYFQLNPDRAREYRRVAEAKPERKAAKRRWEREARAAA